MVLPEFRLPLALFRLGDRKVCRLSRRALEALLINDPQIENVGLDKEKVKEYAQQWVGHGIRQILDDISTRYCTFNDLDPNIIVLKNGSLVEFIPSITEVMPEAFAIHIFRDGRGVVNNARPAGSTGLTI